MKYNHTQTGYLFIFILFILTIFYGFIYVLVDSNLLFLLLILLILFIIASFVTLNVSIDEKYLKIKFGYGMFRKKFLLKDIIFAKAVKNRWYYGWGIKFILPRIWIYNVSGFDAVEIKTKNNRMYRIGTDEPKRLEHAILESIKKN